MRRITAIAAVAASFVLFGAESAVASDTVGWKEVNTNSSWHCSDYVHHRAKPGLKFKACIVKNSTPKAQAILVVQNASGDPVSIGRSRVVFESQRGGDVWCAGSTTLQPGFTRGCYAPSVPIPQCYLTTDAVVTLNINGVDDYTRQADGPVIVC